MPGEPGIFSLEHKYCTVQNARCPLPQKTQFTAAVDTLGLALPQRAPGPDTTVLLFAPLLMRVWRCTPTATASTPFRSVRQGERDFHKRSVFLPQPLQQAAYG